MNTHLQHRPNGSCALYVDGDLQFDTNDEAIYHESLVLPALVLATQKKPTGLNILICGGGDGLALRECLRFPGVASVDLVDYSPDVIALGKSELAVFNCNSFNDPRTNTVIADAWDFLATNDKQYDIIIVDFTVPRKPEDCRVFSVEWYEVLSKALSDNGVISVNGVSPTATPAAFWCLSNTIRAAKLQALPFRSCIPSFRNAGYGVWSFFIASKSAITQAQFKALRCPVLTRQIDIRKLHRASHFSLSDRNFGKNIPVNTLQNCILLPLLLNSMTDMKSGDSIVNLEDGAFDLEPLFGAIPSIHPQHTREMIEMLAKQVVGSLKSVNIARLVESLLERGRSLPTGLIAELKKIKEYLRNAVFPSEGLSSFSARLFAALVITMTLANAVAPDNAFAKGAAGIGHVSMSRGFSGGFAGGRSSGAAPRATSGGFAGGHGPTYNTTSVRVSGYGFRQSTYGRTGVSDIYGYRYTPRVYYYCGGGYGHVHPTYVTHGNYVPQHNAGQTHNAVFVADEDLLIMDNGDLIITLSDEAYLLYAGGQISLMSVNSVDPLMPIAVSPQLYESIHDELNSQKLTLKHEMEARRDWISWIGWSSAILPNVRDDKTELANMEDMVKRIDLALKQIATSQPTTLNLNLDNDTELFVGGYLQENGEVLLLQPDGKQLVTDGATLRVTGSSVRQKCPKELTSAIRSILTKLNKELLADQKSFHRDLANLRAENSGILADLNEYNMIYYTNGYDPNYTVDYGTDEMAVSRAISLTEKDKADNESQQLDLQLQNEKSKLDIPRIQAALLTFGLAKQ